MSQVENVLSETANNFTDQIVATLPDILAGIIFLTLSYLVVKGILSLARASLRKVYQSDEQLIADLLLTLLAVVLWFGVALAFLIRTVGSNFDMSATRCADYR